MHENLQLDPMAFVSSHKKLKRNIAPTNLDSTGWPGHKAAKRVSQSPVAQIPSPRSLTNEIPPSPDQTNTITPFQRVVSDSTVALAPNVRASNITATNVAQQPSVPPTQPNTITQTISDPTTSILKQLSSGKLGSAKEMAAFYLSSFLAHIETLGK
jgi:hypothetical protein